MAGLKKFSIAESGTLVYRSTGKAYRGEYTLKVTPTGVINVYGKNGRRMGTVAAPTTKKAQREMERLDKRRKANETGKATAKKSEQLKDDAKWKRRYKDTIEADYSGYDVPSNVWEAKDSRSWATELDKYYLGGSLQKHYEVFGEIITKQDQSLLNFAKVLEDNLNRTVKVNGVDQPLLSVEEANIQFALYKDALERDDMEVLDSLWADITFRAAEYGYDPSEGVGAL